MILRNLGSGSGGNATVVTHGGRAILIDAGLSKRRMLAGWEGLSLEAVLVTHCHSDHIGPHVRKLGAPVWIEKDNWLAAQCAEALAKVRRPHTVVLGHLSEDCNTPTLAHRHSRRAMSRTVRLMVARQDAPLEDIEV